MAMNAPATSMSRSDPSSVLRSLAVVNDPEPSPEASSSTTYGVTSSMLSLARARSSMICEARNWSRRWTTFTSEANLLRKIASSMAESPPPTISVGLSRKKAASHVAQ